MTPTRSGRAAGQGRRALAGSGFFDFDVESGLAGLRSLLGIRVQPVNEAATLFGNALFVEGNETVKDVFGGQVRGPAVGVQNGGIQVVVNVSNDGDEALLVDGALLLCVELLVGTKLFEDVVHARDGEGGIELLLALAVGVQGFSECADAFALGFGGGREWEGLKAFSLG